MGVWPWEDPILKDKTVRKTVGADFFVTSLEQVVTSCAEVAERADQGHALPGATPSECTVAVSADATP